MKVPCHGNVLGTLQLNMFLKTKIDIDLIKLSKISTIFMNYFVPYSQVTLGATMYKRFNNM